MGLLLGLSARRVMQTGWLREHYLLPKQRDWRYCCWYSLTLRMGSPSGRADWAGQTRLVGYSVAKVLRAMEHQMGWVSRPELKAGQTPKEPVMVDQRGMLLALPLG